MLIWTRKNNTVDCVYPRDFFSREHSCICSQDDLAVCAASGNGLCSVLVLWIKKLRHTQFICSCGNSDVSMKI